jgi:hypothetical protein
MATPKLSVGAIIALAATSVFLTLVTAGMIATQTLSSDGTVTTVDVGVYSDLACSQNCTSISWGTLHPGDTANKTVYVKNTGTREITLSMTSGNWAPEDSDTYLTLTWDQEGTVLDVDDFVTANLTLSVDSDTGDLTDFNFDIVIAGTE